jgi:hypothetical protein
MNLSDEELRSHLNPTALQILKKRLVSGRITPQVFKDILKQQMIKYFFQTYRHPLLKSWENRWGSPRKQRKDIRSTVLRSEEDSPETCNHKRF